MIRIAEPRRAVPMKLQRDRALALCADLMRKLGLVPTDVEVEFELHHEPPLELRPIADDGQHVPPQHEPSCLIWMTKAAHRARTTGRRGESDLSRRGGDISDIAKVKRLSANQEAFRDALLRKAAGDPAPTHCQRISGRALLGSVASGLKRGFDGKVTRR